MTMVPRTGPLSAISALATTSWYHWGKFSDWGVNTLFAIARRGYRRAGGAPGLRGPNAATAIRAVAHRVPARGRGPHRPVQLALRPQHGRHVRPPHRGHRPRPVPPGADRGHRAVAAVAGH